MVDIEQSGVHPVALPMPKHAPTNYFAVSASSPSMSSFAIPSAALSDDASLGSRSGSPGTYGRKYRRPQS